VFISIQWYSKSSRDSARISDISRIKTSLELFHINTWKYPSTTNGFEVTYSGSEVWTQWDFWKSTFDMVSRLDDIPVDPLTLNKYTYSVLNTDQEYEIAWIMEWDELGFIGNSYAWENVVNAIVTWNYNGILAKVTSNNINYVLAVPTIISWEKTLLETIFTNRSFVYTGYKNIPFSYSWSTYNPLGEIDLNLVSTNQSEYVLYIWPISDLSDEDNVWPRIGLLEDLKIVYSWSIIDTSALQQITSITNFTDSNSVAVNLAWVIVNNTLGSEIYVTDSDVLLTVGWLPISEFWASNIKFWVIWGNEYCEFWG